MDRARTDGIYTTRREGGLKLQLDILISLIYNLYMSRLSTDLARYKKILILRDVKKWKFQKIGDEIGISRQRAWELYKRATKRFNTDITRPVKVPSRNLGASGHDNPSQGHSASI